jgi:hypothetical protein
MTKDIREELTKLYGEDPTTFMQKLMKCADKLNKQAGKEGFEIIRNDETGDIDEVMMYCHPDWSK